MAGELPVLVDDAPDGHTSKEGGTQPDEHRDEHEPPGVVTEEGAIELVLRISVVDCKAKACDSGMMRSFLMLNIVSCGLAVAAE